MESGKNIFIDNDVFLASLAERSAGTPLRGDYSNIDEHYAVPQNWDSYTKADHDIWRKLYTRQMKLLPGRACQEFLDGLAIMHAESEIPHFEETNLSLASRTGWKLVAVPGLLPDEMFFWHLANRQFPVTVWIRTPEEFDYIVEPDIFHDYFGHVPLLFNPIFADHLQEYGKGGLKALRLGGLPMLARLYWYTVEFGLINTNEGLRIYGAGILSSGGEVTYSLTDSASKRIPFSLKRIMNTLYKIDTYQETYFVIDSFKKLFDETAPDFTDIYKELSCAQPFSANQLLPGEVNISID